MIEPRAMQISTKLRCLTLLFAGALVLLSCEQSQTPGPWTFEFEDGGVDTKGVDMSEMPDTTSDLPEDAWRGWYKASRSSSPSGFYPQSDLVNGTTGTNESAGCNLQLSPRNPVWTVQPMPAPGPLRRYRLPGGDEPRQEPMLSDDRFGYVDIRGQKSEQGEGGTSAVIRDAEVATAPCDTLSRMGRCGVPEFGDVCSTGVTDDFGRDPKVTVRKSGVQGPRGPLEFVIDVELHRNVADGGTSFRIETSTNPFGPADGRLVDFQINRNTLTTLERQCGSFGGNIVVSYPPKNADGWFRTIPARTRNADENLVLFNLTASGGSVVESAGNQNPESICPTDAFELWFAAEYEPTNP
jgi:hypothetical protein